MDNKKTNTLVITSHKNFEWTSMQEIIPFIEKLWCESADENHHVEIINVDDESLFRNIKKYLHFDNFVMTCFTTEMAMAIYNLRAKLGVKFKLYFYVHGMASIGYWPLRKWKLGNILNKNDCMVVTCDGDIELTRLIYPDIQVLKHPFLNFRKAKILEENGEIKLAFIGRISEQKSLHTLIFAISLIKKELRDKKINLDIFGGEDNLGSPNMGKDSSAYKLTLEKLIKDLNIEDLICFKGFVSRNEIDNYLNTNKAIFVAPSLHSDENFGMSPFNILKGGGRCVLTPWGGFAEFKQHFENQVEYISIFSGEYGPYLCPRNIANVLLKSIENYRVESRKPEYYNYSALKKKISLHASEVTDCNVEAKLDPLALEIDSKREEFLLTEDKNKKNYGAKIFDNYADQNAHKFLNGYAKVSDRGAFSHDDIEVLPWVKIIDTKAEIDDPRLGKINKKFSNLQELTKWLWENGFAYN